MDYTQTFNFIYEHRIWAGKNKEIPVSGPGSSIENTKDLVQLLDQLIVDTKIKSVLDLGCGDLTWMKTTKLFNDPGIDYTGIDIATSIINLNKTNHPTKTFHCMDITKNTDFLSNKWDLIICRDMMFHITITDAKKILDIISKSSKFIGVTSHHSINENRDNLNNASHFSPRNLLIPPFNTNTSTILKTIDEPVFKRKFYLISREQ